ncbi:hypothetical protein I302_108727 [Kwoniella bestiolae CBS 10118]|uniref:Uncharacterized protein n=1 Tax=Kwoniella bestiolae CBS 10118 TaxID=1296100 RepID=A0A1B9FTW8_9TREE|nr:hypothetical protein I302_07864 [Kwoniella bestiolae CBS 10118]OCF22219.1 hypothetical protein I302_07864 [Kwoniella bestiolae CBS 10118]
MDRSRKSSSVPPGVTSYTCFTATFTSPSSGDHLKYLSSVANSNKSSSFLSTRSRSSLDLSVGPTPSPDAELHGDPSSSPSPKDVHFPLSPSEIAALNKVRGLFHPEIEERTILDSIRSGACSNTQSNVPDDNLEYLRESLNDVTLNSERGSGEPTKLATKRDIGVAQAIIQAICKEIQSRETGSLEQKKLGSNHV